MRCLVACCGSEVHIDLRDASESTKRRPQKNLKKRSSNQKNRLLEKLYYELDRPSALVGVNKLYRAARRYGVTRSQVLEWLQLQPGYTLHKPARKHFRRNRVIVFGIDSQW